MGMLRLAAVLLGILVSACMAQGWQVESDTGLQICIINGGGYCHLISTLANVAILAAIGILAVELCFEQISSAKVRRRFVLVDYSISALISAAFLLAFLASTFQWLRSPQSEQGGGQVSFSLFAALLATFAWAGCALLARQRHQAGCEAFSDGEDKIGSDDHDDFSQEAREVPFQPTVDTNY